MPGKSNAIIDFNDFKSAWRIFAKNWYILLTFILLSAATSYIYTYKLPEVSAGRTQILLKSGETYDYQEQMYRGLGYSGGYEDISNQMRVLTSYDIIEKTVSRLNLDVSYFIVGRLKTTEVYQAMPFHIDVKLLNSTLYEKPVNLKIINDKEFRITYEKNDEPIVKNGFFDQEIEDTDFFMLVSKNSTINDNTIKDLKEIDYQFKIHNKSNLIYKYKSSLKVENLDYTTILQLSVEDEIAARAVTFLDTLSQVYIDYTLQSKIDINENTMTYIDRQLSEVIEIMTGIEDDLENYRSQKAILNLSREEEEYFSKLLSFDSQKRNLELQLQSISSLEEYIIGTKENKDVRLLPPAVYIDDKDDFLKKSINELYAIQMNRNNGLFNATETSPAVLQTDQRLDLLRKDMLTYLVNTKKAILSKIEDIKGQLRQYETIIKNIPKTQRDILNITRKLQVNEKMYLYLLEKRANTIIARAGIIPQTKVIETARSIGVVKPDKTKIMYMFIIAGAILSFIVVFFRVVLFERIENSEELKAHTTLPIFGEIIYSEAAEDNYIVVENDPKAAITESFRTVRTNLEYLVSDSKCKIVLITSHNPNEGKTFCSINLASIIAKAGKKVLLLELDLHKPKVHLGLSMTSETGISSILVGKETPESTVLKTSIENLDVILSGPTPPNASELILSNHVNTILEYGRDHYDYVLIDTPPVGLISDAIVLMKYVDATLFVLNTKYAKKEYVANAIELAENSKLQNFGFLLNGVKMKKSKYYYNYSYGYKYGYKYAYGYGNKGEQKKKEEGLN